TGKRVIGEGDAEIDRDPLPALLVPEAVDREIHADLADPAERGEHELIGGLSHSRSRSGPDAAFRRRQHEYITGSDGGEVAVRKRQQEAAALVERLETAGDFALRQTHAHGLADSSGAGKPVATDGGEAPSPVPLCEALLHPDRERGEQRGGRNRCA